MKYFRCIILLLATLLSAGEAVGQGAPAWPRRATLHGRVCDSVSREPLVGVSCIIDSVAGVAGCRVFTGVATDLQGLFSLTVPLGKPFRLSIRYVGYRTFDTVLRLTAEAPPALSVLLSTASRVFDAVEVSAKRSDYSTFDPIEKIGRQHMTGYNEGIEAVLKTLPDVSSNNEMSSQFSVRGGSFDENLVYINDVEIYRPMLIRSGQQEGMSIINPDMVSNIHFSPGGFDATYGDRMASALDITYRQPADKGALAGTASLSLLGASLSLHGRLDKWSYALGLRQHSNRYVFNSLDTKGDYTTHYTDGQLLLGYSVSDRLKMEALCVLSRNVYGLVPESQSTTFGSYMESLELDVYFDGQEQDRYRTALGAVTFKYFPNDEWALKWVTSFQRINENEIYDIQSQYWLYELDAGAVDTGDTRVDRGVGSYLEHARNYLKTTIWNTELRGSHYAALGDWKFGLKLQREAVDDRVREWKWVDSAGYTMPYTPDQPGDSTNRPQAPVLQKFCVAHNQIATNRLAGYLYRDFNFLTRRDDRLTLALSVRGQLYGLYADTLRHEGNYRHMATHAFVSPRLSFAYRPHGQRDLLLRLAAGVYTQAPFYREYRRDDGTLNLDVSPQHSYQAVGTAVYDFRLWERPFQLTADLYCKYVTDLVAYRIDNLRVRYDATNDAVGYATGLSMRLNGEFVPGVQSWASLSLMKTQEDLLADTLGWLDRPTDQRISFKIFFQDYVPSFPFWQMSLSFLTGSGLPTSSPNADNRAATFRLSPYFRVDWGNTLQLSAIPALRRSFLFKYINEIWLTVDVFNLFDYDNEVSYLWVADYDNNYYPVPNKLTGRQLSAKITVSF